MHADRRPRQGGSGRGRAGGDDDARRCDVARPPKGHLPRRCAPVRATTASATAAAAAAAAATTAAAATAAAAQAKEVHVRHFDSD